MEQRYYRATARLLAIFCVSLSLLSENFHSVALTALAAAVCFFCMSYAESLEFDRERPYPILAFSHKTELFCNCGWMGLVLLSVYWINQVCLPAISPI